MKVPLSWLKDFIDLPTEDPEELDLILASLGHELEGYEEIRPTFEGVIVGKVEEVGAHPNADKIRFCRVNDGSAVHDVVCGAWNFEAGAIIAYAQVGSRLAVDTDEPFEIGERELRGVMSHGMISSARELGLGDDHDGILVLDELGAATEDDLGKPFDEVIGLRDLVLDISITPNRGDAMSIRGMARDLAAYWDIPMRDVEIDMETSSVAPDFDITLVDTTACPRFVGYQVDGAEIGVSPLWMQLRLLAIGQRPISNVVDVSNYVMFELGHPIHTFDADTIADQQIIVRLAEPEEKLTTLDGSDRKLLATDIVVADPTGSIALAGVMGGSTTEVSDTTTNILVEAAHWNPPAILATSHRLGLRSEASARFERGVDPNLSHMAASRAAQLIALTAGGSPRAEAIDAYPEPIEPWTITLQSRDLERILGPAPDLAESAGLLDRLGFAVSVDGDQAAVSVPTHRLDVTRPIDLVEEAARLYGYDRFEDRVRHGQNGSLSAAAATMRAIRSVLVGAGLSEAQTLSFIGQADLDVLRLPDGDPRRVGIKVKNPLRDEEGTMRTTLLPGLTAAAARNVGRGLKTVRLFETGRVFLMEPNTSDYRIPHQPTHMGFVLVGDGADVFAGTGIVELLADALRVPVEIRQATVPALHPGRGAEVVVGDDVIGFVGELHPAVARDIGLEGRVAVGEIDLAHLLTPLPDWELADVSSFPPHVFDLAFVIADEVPAARVQSVIAAAAGEHLESVALFDEYRGDAVPAGHRSLAYRLTLRAMGKTLSDEEAAPIRTAVIDAVSDQLSGTLRGA